ncbi:unnamed protein product, partial [Mesorhabditis spiculigera]
MDTVSPIFGSRTMRSRGWGNRSTLPPQTTPYANALRLLGYRDASPHWTHVWEVEAHACPECERQSKYTVHPNLAVACEVLLHGQSVNTYYAGEFCFVSASPYIVYVNNEKVLKAEVALAHKYLNAQYPAHRAHTPPALLQEQHPKKDYLMKHWDELLEILNSIEEKRQRPYYSPELLKMLPQTPSDEA